MDEFLAHRLETLKSQLAGTRLEKSSLCAEISSASTKPMRKEEAMIRFAAIVAELRKLSNELEMLVGKRRCQDCFWASSPAASRMRAARFANDSKRTDTEFGANWNESSGCSR